MSSSMQAELFSTGGDLAIDGSAPSHGRDCAQRRAAGISALIAAPRLPIVMCPTSGRVAGVMAAIERLRLNQVPQNTPVTRLKSSIVMNCVVFMTNLTAAQRVRAPAHHSKATGVRSRLSL